jgi:exopolysaccharide biosynthesis polyprenyl glycosylphosphotransferase
MAIRSGPFEVDRTSPALERMTLSTWETSNRRLAEVGPAGAGRAGDEAPTHDGGSARRSTVARRETSAFGRVVARWPRRTVMISDALAVVLGLVVPYGLSGAVTPNGTYLIGRSTYAVLVVAAVAAFLIAFAVQRLYTTRFIDRAADEIRRLMGACLLGAAALWGVAFMLRADVSRGWAVVGPVMVFGFVALERSALRVVFQRARASGRLCRDVVLVGDNAEAEAIRDALHADPSLGYRVVEMVQVGRHLPDGESSTGALEEIVLTIERSGARGVVLTASALDLPSSNWLVRHLTDAGVHVELSSTLRDVASNRLTVRPLGRFPMIYVEPTQRTGWRARAKRSFDLTVAMVLLVVTFPLLVAAAVAIKLTSPGPVLFRQERVGRDGRRFEVLKLRTMVVDAEARLDEIRHMNEADGPLFKIDRDPRVTRVGAFLRTSSLDELPQLINVVRNEMSLVGPRPALPSEVEEWTGELFGRLRVRPGITGMWQVSGRSDASFDEYMRLDLYYVDNWSLTTDLGIVVRTVPAVLSRRGAR